MGTIMTQRTIEPTQSDIDTAPEGSAVGEARESTSTRTQAPKQLTDPPYLPGYYLG
jgi:hypothetical protein